MERIGIGIIGAGRISHVIVAAYAKLNQARLAAVADVVPVAAEKLAGKFDIPLTFGRYEDLLARPEVDAVLICTPTFLHEEIAIAEAKARKQIF